MTTISQILEMKQNKLRSYYIDSDGDEIVVSDDEDYDVAIDYAKNKGDAVVKFGLCKRQHGDSEGESLSNLEDSISASIPALQNLAESVVVDEQELKEELKDELNNVSSAISEEELSEEQKLDQMLNSQLKETVSEEGSITITSETTEEVQNQIGDIPGVQDGMSSEVDTESQNIPLDKKISGVSNISDSISEEFDIVQSRVHSYAPKEMQKVSLEVDPIKESVEDLKQSQEDIQKSIDASNKKENDAENQSEIVEEQEKMLLEMNKEEEKEVSPEDQFIEDSQLEEQKEDEKDTNPDEKVENNEDLKEDEVAKLIEENKEFKDDPRLGVAVSIAQARVVDEEDKKKANYFRRALESVQFAFNDPHKKLEIADIED